MKDEIKALLMEKTFVSDDKVKINCKDALEIASSLGIEPKDVARVINKEKIKISGCQLGCFK